MMDLAPQKQCRYYVLCQFMLGLRSFAEVMYLLYCLPIHAWSEVLHTGVLPQTLLLAAGAGLFLILITFLSIAMSTFVQPAQLGQVV